MQYESVPESVLFDVFTDVKGSMGKLRSYINLQDFTHLCKRYKLDALEAQKDSFENEDELFEFVFRNMCETISRRESWGIDLQSEDLKLFANQFLIAYNEFPIMQQLSIQVMNERGIFPKIISAPMKTTATSDSFQ